MRSRLEEQVVTVHRAPSIKVPELSRVVDAMLARAEDPEDRRAKMVLALLEKEGALDCPACKCRFHVSGYRATRTSFSTRRSLSCGKCETQFIIEDEEIT